MSDFWEGFITACVVLPIFCGVGLGALIRLMGGVQQEGQSE